jgi:7-carboxy-7-deazaguanine synthase (Cx14CxxC type)
MYFVKELFYTLQGEGAQTGRPAVFCRFSGCNLWSGREQDRNEAICNFCDTDFIGIDGEGGGKFSSANELAKAAYALWPREGGGVPYVVCTGGEPLLQLDRALVDAFKQHDFVIAIETNGTLPAPEGIDWICVSPKGNSELVLVNGDELKLVYPQREATPQKFQGLNFNYFYLQPLDGPQQQRHTQACIQYCRENPQWRLSLQTHKMTGIP